MFKRFLIAAPIAVAVSAAFIGAAASPADAATATNCSTTPAQLRAAAATAASPAAQRKALGLVATGELLCRDNSNFEAGKKFAAAAKALNIDVASLPAVSASAQ